MHAQSSAASIRLTSKPCRHPRDSDADSSDQKEKKPRSDEDVVVRRLRLFHAILREQFDSVEAVYEGSNAKFEIETDAGLTADTLDDNGKLRCAVTIKILDRTGNDAKILVESKDQKMAQNVQDCLRGAVDAVTTI